mgnify:CR=1 FL=1
MVVIHTSSDLDKLRECGRIVALVHKELTKLVAPGITTLELDNIAEKLITAEEGTPAFKGYRGFPFATCCSPNDVIVHGFPNRRKLEEGDILSLDLGVLKNGFYGDAAITVGVGSISDDRQQLIDASKKTLEAAISIAKEGVTTGTIGRIIEAQAAKYGYSVVKNYIGHGIGRELHMEPSVPNYGRDIEGVKLRSGMCICIEPMLLKGNADNYRLTDGWTVKTMSGEISTHVEHQVIIHKTHAEVITI